jgi:two-component system cell cycle response regulator DivK
MCVPGDSVKRTILLIEDNAQNRYLLNFLFESRGYCVVAAVDGPSAFEMAANLQLAAILLDMHLPGMDGYAVAQQLRRCPKLDGVPIIAVTSYAMSGDHRKALASGCDGYFEKPIDPETFVDEVERLLECRKVGVVR